MDGFEDFEWDDEKRRRNVKKHAIDFEEATEVFYGPYLLQRSDRKQEQRWMATGESEGRALTVVFTRREGKIRIISARRARKNEERAYRNAQVGRAPERKD